MKVTQIIRNHQSLHSSYNGPKQKTRIKKEEETSYSFVFIGEEIF